jgi:hypothetical protein
MLDTDPQSCTAEGGINCRESLLYATYLGGTDGQFGINDRATGVAVDAVGHIYVTGWTGSTDFPTTANAFQPVTAADGRKQAFVSVLDPDPPTCTPDPARDINCLEGLLYSTYLGSGALNGDEEGFDIAVDAEGNAHVTGVTYSPDFPVKAPFRPFSRLSDAFVAKLDPLASGEASLVYSSFLGGDGWDQDMQIAVDSAGDVYVSGSTDGSGTFPTTEGAFFQNPGQFWGGTGFVTKITENAPTYFVSAISPEAGGDTGQVTATVYGAGFEVGATVALVRDGQEAIPGGTVVTDPVRGRIEARFDLSGKAQGLWDVVVTNPGGEAAVLRGRFTIEPGQPLAGRVEIIGRSNFRPGGTGRIVVTYSNPGNVDILLPIVIRIPGGVGFSLPVPPLHEPVVPVDGPVDFSGLPITFPQPDDPSTPQDESETVIPLIVSVPPGFTGGFPVTLHHPATNCSGVRVTASAGSPIQPGDGSDCFVALVQLAAKVLAEFIPGGACIQEGFELAVMGAGDIYSGRPSSLSSWIGSILLGAVKCAADLFPISKAIKIAIAVTDLVIGDGGAVVQTVTACGSLQVVSRDPARPGTATLNSECVSSRDPNDIVGPPGAGEARHISGQEPMPYLILFENKPDATAAAQTVVLTDQVDPAKYDLSTLSLGLITFGDYIVVPPPGLSEYTADIDLRPGNELVVRVEAKLDPATGVLTWRFESIDPETGEPTEDPLAGFLPPNTEPPAGDGAVYFTVGLKDGLAHGTEVRNGATIVFDFNEAILTPEWLNTIDTSAPQSAVQFLIEEQPFSRFEVRWVGADTGSGVGTYTVYVSEEGGPFTVWLEGTAETSGMFSGRPGMTYSFFSEARDQAGNLEVTSGAADAITRAGVAPRPLSIRQDGDELWLEWTGPGRLESSGTLRDDFVEVPGAFSPYEVDPAAARAWFWRIVD